MTSRELLLRSARALREAGVPDPEYDAACLLAFVTGRPPLELRAGFGNDISEEQTSVFFALLERRKAREPLQYLLGNTVFLGNVFSVRPGVLIPRPETEMLAEKAIRWVTEHLPRIRAAGREPAVLDLCCGTGCLGISVRMKIPEAQCTLTDLSPEALVCAGENAVRLSAACRILSGDLFEPVRDEKFDLILSNPPYIPGRECDILQPEVLREPRLALDGGADGLDFYRRIAAEAPARLHPGGCLLLEIGYGEETEVRALLMNHGANCVESEKDFSGIPRMLAAGYP